MKPVRFHDEAIAELRASVGFYDERVAGLGQELLQEVEITVARIREHPRSGAPYKRTGFRHCVLRRFPYVIFYLELPRVLWIVAVAHGSRKPGYWRERVLDQGEAGAPDTS